MSIRWTYVDPFNYGFTKMYVYLDASNDAYREYNFSDFFIDRTDRFNIYSTNDSRSRSITISNQNIAHIWFDHLILNMFETLPGHSTMFEPIVVVPYNNFNLPLEHIEHIEHIEPAKSIKPNKSIEPNDPDPFKLMDYNTYYESSDLSDDSDSLSNQPNKTHEMKRLDIQLELLDLFKQRNSNQFPFVDQQDEQNEPAVSKSVSSPPYLGQYFTVWLDQYGRVVQVYRDRTRGIVIPLEVVPICFNDDDRYEPMRLTVYNDRLIQTITDYERYVTHMRLISDDDEQNIVTLPTIDEVSPEDRVYYASVQRTIHTHVQVDEQGKIIGYYAMEKNSRNRQTEQEEDDKFEEDKRPIKLIDEDILRISDDGYLYQIDRHGDEIPVFMTYFDEYGFKAQPDQQIYLSKLQFSVNRWNKLIKYTSGELNTYLTERPFSLVQFAPKYINPEAVVLAQLNTDNPARNILYHNKSIPFPWGHDYMNIVRGNVQEENDNVPKYITKYKEWIYDIDLVESSYPYCNYILARDDSLVVFYNNKYTVTKYGLHWLIRQLMNRITFLNKMGFEGAKKYIQTYIMQLEDGTIIFDSPEQNRQLQDHIHQTLIDDFENHEMIIQGVEDYLNPDFSNYSSNVNNVIYMTICDIYDPILPVPKTYEDPFILYGWLHNFTYFGEPFELFNLKRIIKKIHYPANHDHYKYNDQVKRIIKSSNKK